MLKSGIILQQSHRQSCGIMSIKSLTKVFADYKK